MRSWPILQLAFLLMLAAASEEFFFEYPRKALTEFFQSLKTKTKQPPKTNIQHYHVHYYPMPMPLLAWKAPDKRDLDKLYEDTIRSFGWTGYQYKYVPNPSLIISAGLQQMLGDSLPWDQDILESEDTETTETSRMDRTIKGILVQVPVNQQIVLQLLKKSQKEATI